MSKHSDDLETASVTNANSTLDHYHDILQAAGCCLFVMDETGIVLTMSPSCEAVTGQIAAAFIGEEFINWVKEPQREAFNLAHNTLGEAPITLEFILESALGRAVPVRYTAIQHQATGQFQCMVQAIPQDRTHTHEMLSQVLQLMRDPAYLVDGGGKYIACNRAYAVWIGVEDPARVVGQRHRDFLPPEQAQSLAMGDQGTMRAATTDISETQPIFPVVHGMDTVVPISRKAVFGAAHQLIGVIGRIQDDFQPDTPLLLAPSPTDANRHQAMIEAIPDMMLVLNGSGEVLQQHISSTVVVGAHAPRGAMTHISQMDVSRETIEEMLEYLDEALHTNELQSFEYTHTLDGQTEYYEVRIIVLSQDEAMMLVRNITTLKRVQEELSRQIRELNILRQVDSELVEWTNIEYVVNMSLDAVLRLSYAQSGYLAMVENDNSMSVLSVFGFYNEGRLHALLNDEQSYIRHLMHKQQPQLFLDVGQIPAYQPMLKDTIALIVIPLVSRDVMVGVLVLEARSADRFNEDRFDFLRLITGRMASLLDNARLHRQTEEQLAEMERLYEEVRRLEQLKTDMIRIASHDLKNPLAGIMGNLEILRWDIDHILDDQQKDRVQNIDVAARKMQRITTGILSLERIEQMAQDENQKAFDLTELVRKTLDEQLPDIKQKRHKLTTDIVDWPVYVKGHPIQIHEVMANLLSNACKYTPEKGHIHVMFRNVEGFASVRIVDNGYGIPEQMQKRLFTPFFRAKTMETKSIDGNGLGLHLVKNIIERHGGTIHFESIYKEGSTFGFDLPIVEPDDDDDDSFVVTGATVVG